MESLDRTGDVATRLLEREAELERLDALLERGTAGEGRPALVEGEAGIGKTALLNEYAALAAERGFRVLSGRGGELERDFAWGVIRQLYERPLLELDAAERRELLGGAASLAGPLLGLESPDAGPAALDQSFAVNHGLYWLTANLAEQGPVALVIDDAHWADTATLGFLNYLGRRLEGLALVLVLARRPAEPGAERELLTPLAGIAAEDRVVLAGLSERASGAMIERAIGEPADERFRRACHEATGGNPFLLEELLGAYAAEGAKPTGDAAERVARLGPRSIAHGVLGRLGMMWPDALDLARAVALLGVEAELRHAAAVAELDRAAAETAADALCEARILADAQPLRFAHSILREAVYQDLPAGRRAADHARAARVLDAEGADPDRVALQLLASEPAADEWAVERLRAAAGRALAHGSPEAAISLLQRALAEPPPAAEGTALLTELGWAGRSVNHPETSAWLEGAVEAATEPNARLTALLAAAMLGMGQGRAEAFSDFAARAELSQALETELVLEAEAQTMFALTAFISARRSASAHGWLVERNEPPPGETPGERAWLVAAAWRAVMDNEPAAKAVELAEGALRSGTLLAECGDSWTYAYATVALAYGGQLERALALSEAGLEDARRRGSPFAVEFYLIGRAIVELRRGSVERAAADALDALERNAGWGIGLPLKLWVLSDALRERGELDRAEALLAEHGLASGPPPEGGGFGYWLLEGRGRLRLAQGRPGEALADFLACRDWLGAMGRPDSAYCVWRAGAALAYQQLGEDAEARARADEQLDLARRFGAPTNLGIALRATVAVSADVGEQLDLLEEAVTALEDSSARLEHAKALVELGVALRGAGRAADAREPLERGMEFAHRCRAAPLAVQAREELRALGARPRRLVVSGVDALTAAERRVAELAAGDTSNPEIAQALFVTRRTVEGHLSHVYRKLGIDSREELPNALDP